MLLSQLSRTSNVGVVDQHPAYRMIISKHISHVQQSCKFTLAWGVDHVWSIMSKLDYILVWRYQKLQRDLRPDLKATPRCRKNDMLQTTFRQPLIITLSCSHFMFHYLALAYVLLEILVWVFACGSWQWGFSGVQSRQLDIQPPWSDQEPNNGSLVCDWVGPGGTMAGGLNAANKRAVDLFLHKIWVSYNMQSCKTNGWWF